jgi:hypothetical protein
MDFCTTHSIQAMFSEAALVSTFLVTIDATALPRCALPFTISLVIVEGDPIANRDTCMSAQSDVSVRLDDRIRLMSALLAATDWPEKSQERAAEPRPCPRHANSSTN